LASVAVMAAVIAVVALQITCPDQEIAHLLIWNGLHYYPHYPHFDFRRILRGKTENTEAGDQPVALSWQAGKSCI